MNVENDRGGSTHSRTTRRRPLQSFRTQHKRMAFQVQKMAENTKSLTINTENLRKQLLFQLQALFDMATKAAIDTGIKDWKQKEAWARSATYIAQTINSISETYDLNRIKEDILDLAQMLSNINKEPVKTGTETFTPQEAPEAQETAQKVKAIIEREATNGTQRQSSSDS